VKLVSFDVETRGTDVGYALQPFRARSDEAWITMWACATSATRAKGVNLIEPDPTARRVRSIASLGAWLRECAKRGITIAGWNTAFDMAWLIALGLRDEVYANKWLDGMLLWKHLTASPPSYGVKPLRYGLKEAVTEFYPDEAGYEQDISFDTDDPEELKALEEYNRKDALFTWRLTQKFWSELDADQRRCALIEAACLPMVAESYVEGLAADGEAADVLAAKLEETAKLAMVKLKLNTDEEITDELLASTVQLRTLLYDKWKLPVVKYTDKGNSSTDRDALSQLAPTDQRAGLLNEYREARNNRTKFALGAANSLTYNGDGRVRPSARVFGTYTGRMTYGSKILKGKEERPTGIALHQWKRAKEFRDIILAPPGYTLLEFDFAGQEFRWMAVMSGDRTMLEMCAPGEDAHAYMGAKIGSWQYDDLKRALEEQDVRLALAKNLRQMGKVGNLSCQYRTGPAALMRVARVNYQLPLEAKQARAIHATYRATYPGVPRYWDKQIRDARIDGYVKTIAGRRIQIGTGDTWGARLAVLENLGGDDIMEVDLPDRTWQCESTAINAPIQGSGADQKYLALLVLKDILPLYEGRFYFELHDGIYVIVPDRYAAKAYAHIKRALSNLPYKKAWGVDLPIAFPVDGKAGKAWGSMEERRDWV
jgi:DNA polymerase-1